MRNVRGKILWVDDEIEHLKPHILFLREKGYDVETAVNGNDAIAMSKENQFDLILLDHSMPGKDGIETLVELKSVRSSQLIIMITKTEDEWLMDEAITGQVNQFLIKPINPSQIFIACKQNLEKKKIGAESTTRKYLDDFHEINSIIENNLSVDDWYTLYDRLVDWQIKFDKYKDIGLVSVLDDQIKACNKQFTKFIEKNYKIWVTDEGGPDFTKDIIPRYIQPLLKNDKRVCLLVLDCMRLDHFKAMVPILEPLFNINTNYCFSILPSATPYSRNAIFSGLFSDDIIRKYPEQKSDIINNAESLNRYENQFLKDQLTRLGLTNKAIHYHKIWAVEEGNKFSNKIGDLANQDIIALVVNFVDILMHKSSQMDVLKEMVPNESGYRKAIKSWLEQSWLIKALKFCSQNDITVIMTSDHGSIRVQNSVMVSADKSASSGVRFKFGRNLNANKKNALIIKNPKKYRLPEIGPQPSYVIAKNDNYFVYPNDAHRYQNKIKDSFQHGGISMEEIIIPVAIMESRKK